MGKGLWEHAAAKISQELQAQAQYTDQALRREQNMREEAQKEAGRSSFEAFGEL